MAADFIGSKFGYLTAVEPLHIDGKWRFSCSCGETIVRRKTDVTSGKVSSCGCKTSELHARHATKHGYANSLTWNSWMAMMQRCTNKNIKAFHRYGGRGIRVCDRWTNISNFVSDMGERPSKKHSIDRINNEGNYEPGNCRWATSKVQTLNKCNAIILEWRGESKPAIEWAALLGIPKGVLYMRLHRGWSVERALTQRVS